MSKKIKDLYTVFFFGSCILTLSENMCIHLITGSVQLDQVLQVLLGTAMFVGGLTAFLLDNTVPGKLCSYVCACVRV